MLSWLSLSGEPDPLGGDAVDYEYESLILDGSTAEGYETEAMATEHSIELSADATDHIKPLLRKISLDVVVSAHPGPSSTAWQDAWAIDGEEDTRPDRVRQTLTRLVQEGVEITVETPTLALESMLLLKIDERRTPDTGDAFRALLTFREIRRVSAEDVDAPSPRVERGRRPADRGRQTGEEGEDGAAVGRGSEDRSWALQLLGDRLH